MTEGPSIARVAALIGDPTRAGMLLALLGGEALTATELAATVGITKQTASGHLARLLAASLIAVERQGRHRYHRIAGRDVAELLEGLMNVAERRAITPLVTGPREPALRRARVCYDHLAGELAVACLDHLIESGCIERHADDGGSTALLLTDRGRTALAAAGLAIEALATHRRPACRACLDWSVRRHHLAGALGALLLQHCFSTRWARRVPDSRAVRFSARGEREFRRVFCGDSA